MDDASNGEVSQSEFEALRDDIRKKPGLGLFSAIISAPFAVLIGVLAIFVPREFDTLQSGIDEAKAASVAAEVAAISAKDYSVSSEIAANTTLQELRKLRNSIAEANAAPVFCLGELHALRFPVGNAPNSGESLSKILPPDLFNDLCSSGVASSFLYSKFDGQDWVFVHQAEFNKLNSKLQEGLEESFARFEVNFEFLN